MDNYGSGPRITCKKLFGQTAVLFIGNPVTVSVKVVRLLYEIIRWSACAVGWVNLCSKFEIEKYKVCSKLILKKMERHFFTFLFGTTGMQICMDL